MSSERDILHETEHLWLNRNMEICLHAGTHSVVVGKARDLEHAKAVMTKLERYPKNLYDHMGVIWRPS
jgi:hypothetical protein